MSGFFVESQCGTVEPLDGDNDIMYTRGEYDGHDFNSLIGSNRPNGSKDNLGEDGVASTIFTSGAEACEAVAFRGCATCFLSYRRSLLRTFTRKRFIRPSTMLGDMVQSWRRV